MRLFLLTFLLLVPVTLAAQNLPSDESYLFEEPEANPVAVAKAKEILGPRYQTELPKMKDVAPINLPRGVLPDIITKIALVLGATIILILIFNLFYSSGRFDSADDEEDTGVDGEIDFTQLRVPDPDLLAAEGKFTEAIHALLLRSLVLVSRGLNLAWPRSLTSREILRHGQLPAKARSHLGQLIQRVEIYHFGGLEPATADYGRCQEIYTKLAAELKGGQP